MHMGHAPQEAIKRVKENENDFSKPMNTSDIAYTVTGLVNNEAVWRAYHENDKKKKQTVEESEEAKEAEAEVAQPGRGRGGRKRKDGSGKTASKRRKPVKTVLAGDKGGDKAPVVKARWTMTTKQKYGDDGWSEPGKKFYDVLLKV